MVFWVPTISFQRRSVHAKEKKSVDMYLAGILGYVVSACCRNSILKSKECFVINKECFVQLSC